MRPTDPSHTSPARRITILAMATAALFVAQLALSPLPNIELVSLLVALYTLTFGRWAIATIYGFVLLEGLIFGFHLWWVMYLYVWLLLWIIVTLLGQQDRSRVFWALVLGLYGCLFGFFCVPVYLPLSGVHAALAWWVAGIPMDLVHGAGNAALAAVLFVPLRRVLDRWRFV